MNKPALTEITLEDIESLAVGVTEVPGLYFLGLSWQHTRGSALLGFVNDDAAYLAEQISSPNR